MSRIVKHLNLIGLGLLIGAFVVSLVAPSLRFAPDIAAVLGLAALIAYFILNAGRLKDRMKRRSFLYSSNLLLVIALVLGITVILNVLLTRHHRRFDFTAARVHSISDQSIRLVKALKTDVAFKAFFREGGMGRARLEDLLKIYAYHSPRIKFEFIDPDKNPALVKRYEITADGTTILEAGDKEGRTTGVTEEDVTNALIKVTREKKKTVYFLEGHGEISSDAAGDDGASLAKDELGKMGYDVKKRTLALPDTFPKDCAALIVAGPKKDLLPAERETISAYLKDGGRVLFLLDAFAAPELIPYLAGYGFKLENDLVVDPASRTIGGDYFMPYIDQYETHEITRDFRYATFFPVARTVEKNEPQPEIVGTFTILGRTNAEAYAKRDFVLKEKMTLEEIAFDKARDMAGPLPLAAVATLKAGAGAGPEKEGRLAVVGDSDFFSNRYFNISAGGNFFLNIVNWLAQESDLISIQPKTSQPRTIRLSPAQGSLIFWFSVVLLPAVILAIGLMIWFRRRAL
ncbi:MAG: GldG family protein [Candidatus Aminicenantales bacterium]